MENNSLSEWTEHYLNDSSTTKVIKREPHWSSQEATLLEGDQEKEGDITGLEILPKE